MSKMNPCLPLLALMATLSSCDFFVKQEPAEIQAISPSLSRPGRVDPSDSTFLRIRVNADHYEISLLDKFKKTDHPDTLGSFITANEAYIDKNKIVLAGKDSSDFSRISPVLKKHGFFKVRAELD